MKFGRRFREVERNFDQPIEQLINKNEDGFLQIQSKSNITPEQCNEFWNKLFYSEDKSKEAIQRIAEEIFNQQ